MGTSRVRLGLVMVVCAGGCLFFSRMVLVFVGKVVYPLERLVLVGLVSHFSFI